MANESSIHTVVEREKTTPFLIRAFVKINGFHRLSLFEDGTLPTTDEHQLFTWRDATLPELITTLRITSPTAEYRHPLARFSFRALFADSINKGHFAQRDMGQVTAREMLEESMLLTDSSENRLYNRTLEELRFIPGDYLCIAVHLPKNVSLGGAPTSGLSIKGSANAFSGADASGKWSRGTLSGRSDGGWGGGVNVGQGPPGGLGRGGAHWRARPGVAAPSGRGGGVAGRDEERGDRGWRRDRDRDRDRPTARGRRDSPPARVRPPIPERDRDTDRPRLPRRSRSLSKSRSRSPRRRGRHD